jgi:hypothetical protein
MGSAEPEGHFEGQNGARRRWFRLVCASVCQRITWSGGCTWAAGTVQPYMGKEKVYGSILERGSQLKQAFVYLTEDDTTGKVPLRSSSLQLSPVIVAISWRSDMLIATCERSSHRNGYAVLGPTPCRPKANLRGPMQAKAGANDDRPVPP